MKMAVGVHWCQEGSHKPIDTTSAPRHRLPFHSSRKKHHMEPVCAPCLSPGTIEELSHSAWPHLWRTFLSSVPKSLGLAASRAKVTLCCHCAPIFGVLFVAMCLGTAAQPCSHAWSVLQLQSLHTPPWSLLRDKAMTPEQYVIHILFVTVYPLCISVFILQCENHTVKTNTTTSNCNLCMSEIMAWNIIPFCRLLLVSIAHIYRGRSHW